MNRHVKKIHNKVKSFIFFFISLYFVYLNFFFVRKSDPVFDKFDSPSYFSFTFYPSFRMQLITGIYSFIEDFEKIVLVQSLIYVASWLLLFYAVFRFFDYSWVSIFGVLALAYLGTSAPALEHNFILMSESFNNSGLALMLGSLMLFYKDRSSLALIFTLLSFLLLAGSKSASALAVMFIFIIFVLKNRLINLNYSRFSTAVSILFIFILSFLSISALSSDVSKTLNTVGTINNRLWVHEEWRVQILEAGYPKSARAIWQKHDAENLGKPPDQAVVDTAEFNTWWIGGGMSFLTKFTLTNPDYALLGSICLPCINQEFNFGQTLLAGWAKGSIEYKNYPEIEKLDLNPTLFWPLEIKNSYLLLGIMLLVNALAIIIMIFSKEIHSKNLTSLVILVTIYVFIYSYVSWWFGSKPIDMVRHQFAGALAWRMIFILSLMYLSTWFVKKVKISLSTNIKKT